MIASEAYLFIRATWLFHKCHQGQILLDLPKYDSARKIEMQTIFCIDCSGLTLIGKQVANEMHVDLDTSTPRKPIDRGSPAKPYLEATMRERPAKKGGESVRKSAKIGRAHV